jgi:7-cyano-7-deazaguanine synthase in queuosine biosynthesis
MKTLVAWSGGLDSTALIDYLLKRGDSVSSIYVELPNNGEKVKREQQAIDNMMPYLNHYAFRHLGITSIQPYGGSILSLKQPVLWLTGLIYALTTDYDCVSMGYVMGDCAVSYLSEIRAIWDSFAGLTSYKLPPLTFPLIKDEKIELWNKLPDELKKHVTWCECYDKVIAPCGTCHPCKRAIHEGIVTKGHVNDERRITSMGTTDTNDIMEKSNRSDADSILTESRGKVCQSG